jgi:hypothetical protein
MSTATRIKLETIVARSTMVAVAIGMIAVGVSLLTTPIAIPITVSLWLGAAGLVFLGLFGKLPPSGW